MRDQLLIPIEVDAISLNERNNGNEFFKDGKVVTNSGNQVEFPAPFQTSEEKRKAGIYIHWELPHIFRTGKMEDGESELSFPYAPNRWVIRRLNTETRDEKNWIVFSDRKILDEQEIAKTDSIYTDVNDDLCYIGQVIGPSSQIDEKLINGMIEPKDDFERVELKSISPFTINFSSHQPHCNNVFSLSDHTCDQGTFDYSIVGWYDPIYAKQYDPKGLYPPIHFDVIPAQILASLNEDKSSFEIKDNQLDKLRRETRCLYLGKIREVKWHLGTGESTFQIPDEIISDEKIKISIANKFPDALSALYTDYTSDAEFEKNALLHQCMHYDKLHAYNSSELDVYKKVKQDVEQTGFHRVPDGFFWILGDKRKESHIDLKKDLEQLNDLQRQINNLAVDLYRNRLSYWNTETNPKSKSADFEKVDQLLVRNESEALEKEKLVSEILHNYGTDAIEIPFKKVPRRPFLDRKNPDILISGVKPEYPTNRTHCCYFIETDFFYSPADRGRRHSISEILKAMEKDEFTQYLNAQGNSSQYPTTSYIQYGEKWHSNAWHTLFMDYETLLADRGFSSSGFSNETGKYVLPYSDGFGYGPFFNSVELSHSAMHLEKRKLDQYIEYNEELKEIIESEKKKTLELDYISSHLDGIKELWRNTLSKPIAPKVPENLFPTKKELVSMPIPPYDTPISSRTLKPDIAVRQFSLRRINVIDKFGRTKSIIGSSEGQDQKRLISVHEDLISYDNDGILNIQLPPCINAPSKIETNTGVNDSVLSTDLILGWVIVNNLEGASLFLMTPEGEFIAELSVSDKVIVWKNGPDSKYTSLNSLKSTFPDLYGVVSAMHTPTNLENYINTISQNLRHRYSPQNHDFHMGILGRPLALTRHHFQIKSIDQLNDQWLPMKLGEQKMMGDRSTNDGVIGFFRKKELSNDKIDLTTFYVPEFAPEDTSGMTISIENVNQNNGPNIRLSSKPISEDEISFILLLDPFMTINIHTGLLPVLELKFDPKDLEDLTSNFEFYFSSDLLLTSQFEMNGKKYQNLLEPSKSFGEWNWVSEDGENVEIHNRGEKTVFEEKYIDSGWLKLTDKKQE